ncbi:MAG: hypothetical protein IKB57_02990 [Bacteroidaceae bacterium]|nr:hypothetical protein [Bacteroidaceae bacterium]
MKTNRLLLIILTILTTTLVRANENQPQGIDLGEYAFGIPTNQLNFTNQTPYTFSFWVNVKEYNHNEGGTHFLNARTPLDGWPLKDWGYLSSSICDSLNVIKFQCYEAPESGATLFENVKDLYLNTEEWAFFSLVFYTEDVGKFLLYKNGEVFMKCQTSHIKSLYWPKKEFMFMIGGYAWKRSPLNAYVDKVQFYNRALTQTEVQASMYEPLLNDESLLGYWDFENGCTTDTEGYMMADKGTIKATMYNILQTEDGLSNGTEIKPFTFAEGVNPESVLQGVEESTAEESNTKAYVSAGVLYIENAEGINTVTVYDAMGRTLLTPNLSAVEKGATYTQIELPSTLKGVIMVKVNNEVVKVICE